MPILFNHPNQKDIRRRLRSDPTKAERILWTIISRDQLGVRFRRQHGIGSYVVDFYCPLAKLVIEVDGDSHFSPQGQQSDQTRDQFLQSCGIRVLRVTNTAVYENLEVVLQTIRDTLAHNAS